jgi:hypothetical protein
MVKYDEKFLKHYCLVRESIRPVVLVSVGILVDGDESF